METHSREVLDKIVRQEPCYTVRYMTVSCLKVQSKEQNKRKILVINNQGRIPLLSPNLNFFYYLYIKKIL